LKENELANPGALGLGGFALTTFLLSMVNAGIITPESVGMVLPMAFFYGGLDQVLAGMWEFKCGNIFGATCFTSFGSFWLGLALMIVLEAAGLIAKVPAAGMAVFLGAWGLFTLYATIAAIKAPRTLLALFIALTITFFLLAAGEFSHDLRLAGGYLGIIVALIAWYISAGTLINEMFKRKVLPL
jgi:succinate-acetate transporter protein